MKHIIITISRQFGSGGRKIGHLVAKSLGIPCYDRSIIDKTAKISELSPDFIEKNEQHLSNSFLFDMTMTANIYKAQSAVIKECAEKGSCVIVGRCADKILENDLDQIYEYIALEKLSPENAEGQTDRIKAAILDLDTFPQGHQERQEGRHRNRLF